MIGDIVETLPLKTAALTRALLLHFRSRLMAETTERFRVPTIIDYDIVLAQMVRQRMRSLYFNSGAFGFNDDVAMQYAGWIGAEDSTIRPEARRHAKLVPAPVEATLARLTTAAWTRFLPASRVWVMPKSSWAYELDFGSKIWLPGALQRAGVNPMELQGKTNAPAIEFQTDEAELVRAFVETLLQNLLGSDFALAFPGHPVTCTVHHHKQIWWTSSDAQFIATIDTQAG